MIDSIDFLHISYVLSIVMLVATLFITVRFIIPLQIKQANVHNGLRQLRRQLLLKGVIVLLICLIAIALLVSRFYVTDVNTQRFVATSLVFLFSLALSLKQLIESRIYHTQYSEESKKLHKKIEKIEKNSKK